MEGRTRARPGELPQRGRAPDAPPSRRPGVEAVLTATRAPSGLDLDPEEALRRAPQLPRGAWERDGGWAVFGGCSVALRARSDPGNRFRSLVRAAGRVRLSHPRLARWYGGLSFHAGHREGGFWRSFPDGLFLLPAWELRRDRGGVRLLAHVAVDAGTDRASARREAVRRIDRVADRLASPAGPSRGEAGGETGPEIRPGGTREAWRTGVEEALRHIDGRTLEKVVLARSLDVSPPEPRDPTRVYANLRRQEAGANLFFWQPAPGRAFLGASPELLGALASGEFRATAVAGSIRRGRIPREDEELARRLAASDKDRREQAIVAEEIREVLAERLDRVRVEPPRLLKLARIQHLESRVRARTGGGTHLLDILSRVHPTPAVCGRPRGTALGFLRDHEPFDRGWYAGPVGWFDGRGEGAFVPGLRSAVWWEGRWRLFAGAGIVEGSRPGREWRETGMKFRPVLRALEMDPES